MLQGFLQIHTFMFWIRIQIQLGSEWHDEFFRLEVGPLTFIRKEHESIIEGPNKMISLPPKTYCKIQNPILRDKKKQPVKNLYGEIEIQRGEIEYRTADDYADPFPLFPGV